MVIIHRVLLLTPEEEKGLPWLPTVRAPEGAKVDVPASYAGSMDELANSHCEASFEPS